MNSKLKIGKSVVAGLVVLGMFGSWLAMEWTGRQPDSLIMLGAVAIALGAGYHLWGEAMSSGVDAVGELQGEDSNNQNDTSTESNQTESPTELGEQ